MKKESDEALYDEFMPEAFEVFFEDEPMDWINRLPPNWEEVITQYIDVYNRPADASHRYGTIGNPGDRPGQGKVDEEVLEHFKREFDLEISRWRSGKHSTDGQMQLDYHFMTTLFHDVMKDFPGFNKFGYSPPGALTIGGGGGLVPGWEAKVKEKYTWCHAGANWAFMGTPKIGLEQNYFSEWVYHGLFPRTYAMLSWLWNGIVDYTPEKVDPLNCAIKNIHTGGSDSPGDTPNDMNLQFYKGDASDPGDPERFKQYCMAANHNDTIGPITNQHKTHYPALASEQAFRRGLLAARYYPLEDLRTHQTRDVDASFFQRDKLMIFNTDYDPGDDEVEWVRRMFSYIEPKSDHNKEMPRGCRPFDRWHQDELTADWGGAGYGKANHLNPDYHGHRHVRAHFRFIRCCPWIPYLIISPNGPFQLQ